MSRELPARHQLYQRCGPVIFRRARALLRDEGEAAELVQDLMVSLLEQPEKFSGQSQWATYVYRMTTNACLNLLRNRQTRLRLVGAAHESSDAAAGGTVQSECRSLSPEQWHQLRTALTDMPEPLATVAVYRYLDGMSHEEIAECMQCSRRHVGNLLTRLRQWGQQYWQEAGSAPAPEAACLTP